MNISLARTTTTSSPSSSVLARAPFATGMRSYLRRARLFPKAAVVLLGIFLSFSPALLAANSARSESSKALSLWDTLSPLDDQLRIEDRGNWKLVPDDLLLLEKDFLKASSDPGYYGREYSFKGDAVVETPAGFAVFRSSKGCVTVYARQRPNGNQAPNTLTAIVDVCSANPGDRPPRITAAEVSRNAADQIVLRVSFSQRDSRNGVAVFAFDKTGMVEITPTTNMNAFRLAGPIAYGVVPGFIGDDLIFGGPESPTNTTVTIPSESLFLGLLEAENAELVVTWPRGKQGLSLSFEPTQQGSQIRSLLFNTDGQPFYLAALSAPGLWHRESLTSDYLEKDVKSSWKPPFPAKWKTQLFEEETKTTFTFRESKSQVWRGVAGSYEYPVWLNGGDAIYHLGKKVQPKGESLVYFVEGRDTPLDILPPSDVLKQTLGRPLAAGILDYEGRKLRTHHRRGGDGVRRACTCGCTEAIQAVFEAKEEASQQEFIKEALEDMAYFVERHVQRIDEYRQFFDRVSKKLNTYRRSSPGSASYLDSLEEIARQIPQECEVQKENMKTSAYVKELSAKTLALASKHAANNLKAYMELLKAWRDMGGAQDYVVAKCHIIARNLCMAAGYGCGSLPNAVPIAEDIRAECRQVLRNPDGYEVWADY